MKKFCKILSLILILTMCLSLLHLNAFADDSEVISGETAVVAQEDETAAEQTEVTVEIVDPEENPDEPEVLEEDAEVPADPEVPEEEPAIEETIKESQPDTLKDAPETDKEEIITESFVYINPLYEGLITEDDLVKPNDEMTLADAGGQKSGYIDSLSDAGDILREDMVARNGSSVVTVDRNSGYFAGMDASGVFYAVLYEAIKETGDPKCGDYLRYQYGGASARTSTSSTYITITYAITYYTTADQEATVTSKVEEVLDGLNLAGKTEDYKIAKIYDYITSHVVYDYDNLEDDSYLLKYSAYAALINGTAVCQGYANLFYRFCLEAGLSARVVSGTGNGGPHGWNIVGINGLYYDVDSTWDAGTSPSSYRYFLKCDANFVKHTRGTFQNMDYTSSSFYSEYPMSSTDYGYPESAKVPVTGIELSSTDLFILPGESCTITVNVLPEDAYNKAINWSFPDCSVGFSRSYTNKYCTITPTGNSGYVTVKATTSDGNYSATLTVRVNLSGTCGENLNWMLAHGILTITGTGAMTDYDEVASYAAPWYSYRSQITAVSLPEGITTIGKYAFAKCMNLTEITIPDGVTSIGKGAFTDCTSLAQMTLPCSALVSNLAGNNCTALTKLHLTVGTGTMHDNSIETLLSTARGYLTTLILDEGITAIENYAFRNCTKLTSVTLPDSLTTIGYNSFYYCTSLEEIAIPENVTRIYDYAFDNCTSLTDVYYDGTAAQWKLIQIGSPNSYLTGAIIHHTGSCIAEIAEGVCTHQCELCKEEMSAVLPAVAPTCAVPGLTEGSECPDCHAVLVAQETIPALGHTEETIAGYPATCTEPGLTDGTQCSVCHEILVAQTVIPAPGHTEETIAGYPATCTEPGLTEGKKCSVCGEILVAQETIPATGHTEEILAAVAPTCTIPGLTEGKKCSVCGEILVAQTIIPATGHTEEILAAVPATCTEPGLTEGKKCSVCGEILVAQETIPATGHTEEILAAVPATCTEPGLTEGKKCSVCGEILVAQETIPAPGHTEETIAGYPATCTEPGLTEGKKCSVCGEILVAQETIPALGHTEETIAGHPATCTEPGLTDGKKCSVCGEILVAQTVIPALGHTEETIAGHPATCTEAGHTEGKKCSVCGEILVETTVIPATGHTEEILEAVPATCTETGLTEGKKCSVCGEILVAQQVIDKLDHQYNADGICEMCGQHQEGWFKEDGIWRYYIDGVAATGWQKVGGKWYYFNSAGDMQTGWQKIGGKWYYFSGSGAMQIGWQKISNTWYYFNSSGAMVTGWQQIGGKWYFFKSSGAMAAGEWCEGYWLNADGSWTYKPKGSWHQDSKGWWFGDTSGWYAKNTTIKIDGKSYKFNASGYWVK